MELRLTDKEEELLRELLQDHHKHLLHEINKADHHEFKTGLRNVARWWKRLSRNCKRYILSEGTAGRSRRNVRLIRGKSLAFRNLGQ